MRFVYFFGQCYVIRCDCHHNWLDDRENALMLSVVNGNQRECPECLMFPWVFIQDIPYKKLEG